MQEVGNLNFTHETITINNDTLTATISCRGAELIALSRSGTDYLWSGDPRVWGQVSPLLFPVVGRQIGDTYSYNGRKYHMPQHGFAMDMDHDLVERTDGSAALVLSSSSYGVLREIYPFDFSLRSDFELDGDTLIVKRTVINAGNSEMFCSIGEHTGYRLPVGTARFEDCFIEFSEDEDLERYYLDDEIIVGKEDFLHGRVIRMTRELFDRGALIFKVPRSKAVTLKNSRDDHSVRVSLDGFENLGIWAKPGADYVCIEPWNGIASSSGASDRLEEKESIRRLAPQESETFVMKITIK